MTPTARERYAQEVFVKVKRKGVLAALLAMVAALGVGVSVTGSASAATSGSIVIGWAFDSKGNMSPFDGPALAAATARVKQVNARGGVQIKILTCDTQNNNPAKAKACAISLLGQGANVIFTTCDVDYATPVVQEAINRGVLAIAPCIGTDQMGPKRFGSKGALAFSFGNVAQDEGSAMAQWAYQKGWRSAGTGTNTLLAYFKVVVQAFEARFKQLGGKIVDHETYATGANNVQAAVSRLNGKKADVYVTSTSFGELPAFVTGMRALGNDTPILNSWAGDGTYWVPKAGVTNYYAVTFASAFGDDPNPAVNKLAKAVKAGTGGFVTGAAAIDGLVTAYARAGNTTNGTSLAAQLVKFKKVPTLSGLVSFTASQHTVFGRQYRVISISGTKARVVGSVVAKVVPKV
ncbi:MAG: branched-chain amino acid transport system substrate-binding protein [Gaiellales bacterium]|nr:branched-chain amino acid transport system substrate-binding protein [Gaiellales bacterium]